jgi:hypothetical protein
VTTTSRNQLLPIDYWGAVNNPNYFAEHGIGGADVSPALGSNINFDPSQYWQYPYVSFRDDGTGVYDPPGSGQGYNDPVNFRPDVPAQFANIPGLSTPQGLAAFYSRYGPQGPPPAVMADITQQGANVAAAEQARQTALESRRGSREGVFQSLLDFQDDPTRQSIQDLLLQRSTGDLITPAERGAAELELAQASAIARNTAAASAANRGVAGGGVQQGRDISRATQTTAERLGINAKFDAINRGAQDRAIDLLSKFRLAGENVELGYQDLIQSIDRDIASLEADVPLSEIDFLGYESLQFGQEVYAANEAYRQASLEAFAASQDYDANDAISDALNFLAGGGWNVVENVWQRFVPSV